MGILRKSRQLLQQHRGQSMVEFALILPILLLLLTGIVDFGLLLHDQLKVSEAAREGARTAALGGNNANVYARVNQVASGLSVNTTIIPEPTRIAGNTVNVTVRHTYSFITPMIGSFFNNNFTASGVAIMRVETGN